MNQTVLTILIAVAAGVAAFALSQTKEGFWMTPSRTWKVDKMFKEPGASDFFSTPNFQAILSPRFSNVDYGPDLRTQFPNYVRMGVPHDPLSEGPMPRDPLDYAAARDAMGSVDTLVANPSQAFSVPTPYKTFEGYSEVVNPGYTQRPNVVTTQANGWQTSKFIGPDKIPLDPHNAYSSAYANGNYNQVLGEVMAAGATGWPTSTVEELDTATFMSPDGEMKQPIIYDRYMYANRNSRLRGQGDPIRGDLPIVPISGSWFIPSGAFEGPNVVLQQGAMNVMGGVNNETNNQLANLIYNASGGAETAIGGVDMARTNMSHSVYGANAAAQGDVTITAFP